MMEAATTEALYLEPAHPYTRALLDAIPVPDPDLQPGRLERALPGELPSPLAPPRGCVFHTRCPFAIEICRRERPAWERAGAARNVACHRWREWPQLAAIDSDARNIES
jgi:oligopeptide/dipeptide ABC transporter ATP-binding protein